MDNKISFLEKVFNKRGYKFLLFLVSYVLAVVVTLIIAELLDEDSTSAAMFIGVLLYFPMVIAFVIPSMDDLSLIFGWAIYIFITLVAVFVKNRRTAKILYIIFVLLLILNIGGCVAMIVGSS